MNSEERLIGTPYLMDSDDQAIKRFQVLLQRSSDARERAIKENNRIRSEAEPIVGPYVESLRADLVSTSNEIEGIDWTVKDAQDVVLKNKHLLDGPTRTLVSSVRSDARVYEVLGLYKAHELADAWTGSAKTPLAHEIRELHALILGDVPAAGTYKRYHNEISGSDLRTAEPFDVSRLMISVADWWASGSGDPVLNATVIHAWIAHIHPFEDGNGRLARVLANLELARNNYPPLVIRAGSDRGQYYSALAASDQGDLLPLYDLFVMAVRRQVSLMASPKYVREIIHNEFLLGVRDRFNFWTNCLSRFQMALSTALDEREIKYSIKGRPTIHSFKLLSQKDDGGNGWFMAIGPTGREDWLLWFGYQSQPLADMRESGPAFPSIYISRRDPAPDAPHPFLWEHDRFSLPAAFPDEIYISPAENSPVSFRRGYSEQTFSIDTAAKHFAAMLP